MHVLSREVFPPLHTTDNSSLQDRYHDLWPRHKKSKEKGEVTFPADFHKGTTKVILSQTPYSESEWNEELIFLLLFPHGLIANMFKRKHWSYHNNLATSFKIWIFLEASQQNMNKEQEHYYNSPLLLWKAWGNRTKLSGYITISLKQATKIYLSIYELAYSSNKCWNFIHSCSNCKCLSSFSTVISIAAMN